VPDRSPDPIFDRDGRRDLTSIDHLRLAAAWAGFPGLAAHEARKGVRAFRAVFAAGLEPF
jgi:hypothetical protein